MIRLKRALIAFLMLLQCNAGFAAVNPAVINMNYWYDDADIREVVSQHTNNKSVYIAPAVSSSYPPDLVKDIMQDVIKEARSGKAALVPINIGDSHWTALAVRTRTNGDVVVLYNDSLGGGADATLSKAIHALDPRAQVIDLQVAQQSDGTSCGAFTAENLIILSKLDATKLTEGDAKAALAHSNRDARALRLSHILGMTGSKAEEVYRKVGEATAKARVEAEKNTVSTVANVVIPSISHHAGNIYQRLGAININERGGHGVSSGDDELSHGIWVRGSYGNGNHHFSKSDIKYKSTSHSFTAGADTKIHDDIILGIAIGTSQNNVKPKSKNHPTNSSNSNIQTILATGYGSWAAGEQLTFDINIGGGKLSTSTKNRDMLGESTIKGKGNIFTGGVLGNYNAELASIIVTPSLGCSYDQITLSSAKQSNINASGHSIQRLSLNGRISAKKMLQSENVNFTLGLHAGASYSPFIKAKDITVTSLGGVVAKNSVSLGKSSFTGGASIDAMLENFELGLGYERGMQQNSTEQSGQIKIRVNF